MNPNGQGDHLGRTWSTDPAAPATTSTQTQRRLPPIPDRQVLTEILFVLVTGIPGEMLLKPMGCSSDRTYRPHLCSWQQAESGSVDTRGCWTGLGNADKIDWSRACLESVTVPAPEG